MRRLMLAAFAVSITGCLSAHNKRAVAPITPVAQSPATSCASPLFVVDGVVQPSTCGTAKEAKLPKCDSTTPIYVVDGVAMCEKPASRLERP
jgi:hypothetical protein